MRSNTKADRRKVGTSRSLTGAAAEKRVRRKHERKLGRHSLSLSRSLNLTFDRWGILKHGTDLQCAYIDHDHAVPPRLPQFWPVCRIVGVRPLWIEYQRTKRGWHVRIYLDRPLRAAELVAFQSLCGSDGRREALNLMRVLAIRENRIRSKFWRARWNILFAGKLK